MRPNYLPETGEYYEPFNHILVLGLKSTSILNDRAAGVGSHNKSIGTKSTVGKKKACASYFGGEASFSITVAITRAQSTHDATDKPFYRMLRPPDRDQMSYSPIDRKHSPTPIEAF